MDIVGKLFKLNLSLGVLNLLLLVYDCITLGLGRDKVIFPDLSKFP